MTDELKVQDGMNYRTYVASDERGYLDGGKLVADLMWEQGLRRGHTVVDIGAGSLRVGRWLLENVASDDYYYIEPNRWLVDEAMLHDNVEPLASRYSDRRDFNVLRAFDLKQPLDYGLISAVLIHVDHPTLRQALLNAKPGCSVLIFDTFQHGPDWTGRGWLYPEIACHADSCVQEAAEGLGELSKLHMDYRGAQWWRLQ